MSRVVRLRGTPATAGAALVASATLTIVLAAQAVLACTRMITVALPGARLPGTGMHGANMAGAGMAGMAMPGMPMAMPGMPMHHMAGTLMICPVVLALAAASLMLTLLAALQCARDPHRALAGRVLARTTAALPLAPATMTLAFLGAGGVGTMMAVDENAPVTLTGWLSLVAIIAGAALVLTFAASVLSRIVVALGDGVAIVIAALRVPRVRFRAVRAEHVRFARARCRDTVLIAAGHGLRAPPSPVR